MLTKTLQDGLNDHGVGAKIRALRLKKKIGLVDLRKHAGLSPALSLDSRDCCRRKSFWSCIWAHVQ